MAHAQPKGFEPAVQQKAGMGIERTAEVAQRAAYTLDKVGSADDSARGDVGMAVQVLGGAVQGKVETELRWPKVNRACKGIVDNRNRLDVNRPRVFLEAGRPRKWVVAVDKVDFDPQAGKFNREKIVRSSVKAILGEDMVARLEQGQESG